MTLELRRIMMTQSKQFAALDEELNLKCQKAKIPGMALVVAKEGIPIFEKYYGFRDVEQELEVTSDTVFGVASITKSFAALAIMQLADEDKLSVDDLVTKWLPEFKLPESYEDQVTIHHLMTHTSGLPGLPAVHQARAQSIKNDPDGEYLFGKLPELEDKVTTVVDLLDLLGKLDYNMLNSPGNAFNYSNECFALLQEIIERASGQTFIEYMDEHILGPLNMEHSTFLTDDLQHMERVTELYAFTQDEKKEVFHSPAWWDVGDIYSNGSLKASVSDLIKYLEVYRLNGTVNGEQIVSESSVEQMMTPQATAPNDHQYGYGLQVHDRFGLRLVGHGGGIKGVSSNMLISKEHGVTVAVLTNIADVAAEDLAMTAMRHVLEVEEVVEGHHYDISTEVLEQYSGTYESMEGHAFCVTVDGKKLRLDVDHQSTVIDPVEKDGFLTPDGKKVVFLRNELDEVIGIFSGLRYTPKISS